MFEPVFKAKKLWEKFRPKNPNVTTQDKLAFINQVLSLLEGKILAVARKSDASRVIQTCIKYGSEAQLEQIISELKGKRSIDPMETCEITHTHTYIYIPRLITLSHRIQATLSS